MVRRWLPHLQILAAALLFSTGGMGVKSCGLPEAQIASFRCGIAALVLLMCLPWLGRRAAGEPWAGPLVGWSWRHWMVGFFYAATLVGFVLANKATSAANVIFLQATAPIYVFILAPRLLGERRRRSDLWAMIALAVGMVLLLSGEVATTAVAPAPLRGNLLGVMCGLAWAATLMGLRFFSDPTADGGGEEAVKAVVAGNVLGCLLVLPWALAAEGDASSGGLFSGSVAVGDIIWLLYLGIFQVGAAYLLLTRGLRRIAAFDAAILLLAEPLFNPIWAYWVHSEVPRGLALVGALIILLVTVARPFLERRPAEIRSHG